MLTLASTEVPTEAERMAAREEQAGGLETFSADFEVWKNKEAAIKVIQTPHDGRFRAVRKWVSQFYMPREEAEAVQQALNGVLDVPGFPNASGHKGNDFESDCFQHIPAATS